MSSSKIGIVLMILTGKDMKSHGENHYIYF